MKSVISIYSILCLIILTSCGNGSDDGGNGLVGEISQLVGYDGPNFITESNMSNFPFSGKCVGEEQIVLSGSIDVEIDCENGSWQKSLDLSLFPNGVFSVTIKTASGESTFNITKNTIALDAQASFKFELADLGIDSNGSHNAVSVNNMTAAFDSEQGNSVSFNGADSSIVLNDGNFLNDAFTQRSIALTFKVNDLTTTQIIYDEGGATNAIGLKIEANSLVLATRVGGNVGMKSVSVDLSTREGQWIKVLATFDNGELKLATEFEENSMTTAYAEIPTHSDTGGLGMRIGSDAFDSAAAFPYSGSLDDVMIFSRAFTESERSLYLGKSVEPIALDTAAIGRIGLITFENVVDLGENSSRASGIASNVSQGSDLDQGNTAVFSGDGSIQLSDGAYFNEAFETRAYALYFKTTDSMLSQTLIDEGGTTNGISLVLENGYLKASVRNGGSSSQVDLIADISGQDDEWIKVIVTFDRGEFSMHLSSEESVIQRTTSFTEVPLHTNAGGIGKTFSADASGFTTDRFFSGEMSKFSIYERALTSKEIAQY